MELSEETVADLTRRLRRVGGQVAGIEQMLTQHRDCRDVMMQISAANKALEHVGFLLVSAGMEWCLDHPAEAAAAGYDRNDVRRMFLKLA